MWYNLSFYKYPRLSRDEHTILLNSLIKEKENKKSLNDFVTLGRFDRMTLKKIEMFSKSRQFSDHAKKWHGDYLSVLLYDLDCNTLAFSCDENEALSFEHDSDKNYRFIGCTLFNLSDHISPVNGKQKEALLVLKTLIEEKLNNLRSSVLLTSSINFSVLGALGFADLCIIWRANQYTDILSIVSSLQEIACNTENGNIYLFKDFLTTVSINRNVDLEPTVFPSDASTDETGSIAPVLGEVSVFLSLKKGGNIDNLKKEFEGKGINFYSCTGDYDVSFQAPAKDVLPLFLHKGNKYGLLHYHSDFYKANIVNTITYLCNLASNPDSSQTLSETNLETLSGDIFCNSEHFSELVELIPHIENFYSYIPKSGKSNEKCVRQAAKEMFLPSSHFVDDFDALFLDFKNYIFSTHKVGRRLWLAKQFHAVLTLSKALLDTSSLISTEANPQAYDNPDIVENPIVPNDLYPTIKDRKENIRYLLMYIKTRLQHETEANVAVLDAPLTNINYNGHQDMLLNAYNNYVLEILNIPEFVGHPMQAIVKGRNGTAEKKAKKICPIVSTSTVFQLYSTMHSCSYTEQSVIYYELPTVVMLNLPFGLFSLQHETFHYVDLYTTEDNKLSSSLMDVYLNVANVLLCELSTKFFSNMLAYHICSNDSICESKIFELMAEENLSRERAFTIVAEEIASKIAAFIKHPTQVRVFMNATETLLNSTHRELLKLYGEKFLDLKTFLDQLIDMILYPGKFEKNTILTFDTSDRALESSTFYGALSTLFASLLNSDQLTKEIGTDLSKLLIGLTEKDLEKMCIPDDNKKVLIETYKRLYFKLVIPFKELKADIPMLDISNISLTDYLLNFIQNSMLVEDYTPYSIKWPSYVDVRLAMAAIYLHLKKRAEGSCGEQVGIVTFSECLKQIRDEFIGRYVIRAVSTQKITKNKVEKYKLEAETYFNSFTELAKGFDAFFLPYLSSLWKAICGFSYWKIIPELKNEKLCKKTWSFLRNYTNAEADAAKEIQEFADKAGPNASVTNDKLRKVMAGFHEKIMKYNLEFILAFQSMPPKPKRTVSNCSASVPPLVQIPQFFPPETESAGNTAKNVVLFRAKIKDTINADKHNLFEIIDDCVKHLKVSYKEKTGQDFSTRNIWFRGQSNADWPLIPSIFRDTPSHELYGKLSSLYHEFKYRCDGTAERDSLYAYSTADYIALMQHFSVDTNFLDFTEDALAALFFALGGYTDESKEKKGRDIALYVFNPYYYNLILNEMAEAWDKKITEDLGYSATETYYEENDLRADCKKNLKWMSKNLSLPNLSIDSCAQQFHMLLCDSAENFDTVNMSPPPIYLPVAVHTSKLNPRLKTQHGAFLAYNIKAQFNDVSATSKMGLMEIQSQWHNMLKANLICGTNHADPFVFKILIKKEDLEDIADMVSSMGMSKERIYPELENIGKRISKFFQR